MAVRANNDGNDDADDDDDFQQFDGDELVMSS